MGVSSFFPHAAPPKLPPPVEPSFVTTTAPAAPIRSAPPSSDRSSAAVGLRFPAARSVLWDRTPQGDKQTLRAPAVRLVLSSHVLERLCGQARDAATGHALGALSAEAERGLSRVGQRALAPLVLSVSSSAQPASHVQPQTCTVAVRVEPWYDGAGPCPSEEVYASLVSCSDLGFGGARRPGLGPTYSTSPHRGLPLRPSPVAPRARCKASLSRWGPADELDRVNEPRWAAPAAAGGGAGADDRAERGGTLRAARPPNHALRGPAARAPTNAARAAAAREGLWGGREPTRGPIARL